MKLISFVCLTLIFTSASVFSSTQQPRKIVATSTKPQTINLYDNESATVYFENAEDLKSLNLVGRDNSLNFVNSLNELKPEIQGYVKTTVSELHAMPYTFYRHYSYETTGCEKKLGEGTNLYKPRCLDFAETREYRAMLVWTAKEDIKDYAGTILEMDLQEDGTIRTNPNLMTVNCVARGFGGFIWSTNKALGSTNIVNITRAMQCKELQQKLTPNFYFMLKGVEGTENKRVLTLKANKPFLFEDEFVMLTPHLQLYREGGLFKKKHDERVELTKDNYEIVGDELKLNLFTMKAAPFWSKDGVKYEMKLQFTMQRKAPFDKFNYPISESYSDIGVKLPSSP